MAWRENVCSRIIHKDMQTHVSVFDPRKRHLPRSLVIGKPGHQIHAGLNQEAGEEANSIEPLPYAKQ